MQQNKRKLLNIIPIAFFIVSIHMAISNLEDSDRKVYLKQYLDVSMESFKNLAPIIIGSIGGYFYLNKQGVDALSDEEKKQVEKLINDKVAELVKLEKEK